MDYVAVEASAQELDALAKKKDETQPDVPQHNKLLPILDHVQAIEEWSRSYIGSQGCPIWYLINPDHDDLSSPAPAFEPGQLYAEGRNSCADELIARACITSSKAKMDRETLFDNLSASLKGTAYSSTLDDYTKCRDGVAALASFRAKYANSTAQEESSTSAEKWMRENRWTNNGNTTLLEHGQKHERQYAKMVQAAASTPHITAISERQRVTYLLDSIAFKDPDLAACIANIKSDDLPGGRGKRNDFDACINELSKVNYVGKKKKGTKKARVGAEISGVRGGPRGDKRGQRGGQRREKKPRFDTSNDPHREERLHLKGGIGKTGVELRFHTEDEINNLPSNQKSELYRWRATEMKKRGKANSGGRKSKLASLRAEIATAVASQLSGMDESSSSDEDVEEGDTKAAIAAAVEAALNSLQKKKSSKDKKGKKSKGRLSAAVVPQSSLGSTPSGEDEDEVQSQTPSVSIGAATAKEETSPAVAQAASIGFSAGLQAMLNHNPSSEDDVDDDDSA